ncbi:hypothetical protein O7626_41060 [Micromonospora sp. WMMD1102]|uniref:hypothetical protein n=1 Tax=Micromonospora sp. WMMD1102 TaxID=3016105 RepID=UPI002414F259|nr:hypothetical protein [Micromonospora sp. WMMD1102]MDG4784377.1 hypothetical protein [Micromonospora sp. WMMD1102]MDG4792195.1 hypothetical protein [Micromonospora sp. WMMD1102]
MNARGTRRPRGRSTRSRGWNIRQSPMPGWNSPAGPPPASPVPGTGSGCRRSAAVVIAVMFVLLVAPGVAITAAAYLI